MIIKNYCYILIDELNIVDCNMGVWIICVYKIEFVRGIKYFNVEYILRGKNGKVVRYY